jgi:hypothetical protein
MRDVQTSMRLACVPVLAVLLVLACPAARAQTPPDTGVSATNGAAASASGELPVSLDRIKSALEQPVAPPLRGLDESPTFRISVEERQRIKIEDLINSLDFRSGPTPAGGLYAYEQQRRLFPPVDNPLRQPYSEFSQPELTTVLIENLAGHYLAGRAASAITSAERAQAEARAREEVIRAITEYCAAQPNGGAGIRICANPSAIR